MGLHLLSLYAELLVSGAPRPQGIYFPSLLDQRLLGSFSPGQKLVVSLYFCSNQSRPLWTGGVPRADGELQWAYWGWGVAGDGEEGQEQKENSKETGVGLGFSITCERSCFFSEPQFLPVMKEGELTHSPNTSLSPREKRLDS